MPAAYFTRKKDSFRPVCCINPFKAALLLQGQFDLFFFLQAESKNQHPEFLLKFLHSTPNNLKRLEDLKKMLEKKALIEGGSSIALFLCVPSRAATFKTFNHTAQL